MRRRAYYALAAALLFAVGLSLNAKKPAPASPFTISLSGDQKIVHALNRLTFGPRPGDFDQAGKMGLKKWIDLQLHPDRIAENPLLNEKLAPLDTLRMTPLELARNYPPPQLIKAMVEGKVPYPRDPEQRMMVERVARRLKNKNGDATDQAPTLENVGLTDGQQRILRRGAPDEKLKIFDSLLDEQKDEVLEAMPQGARIGLFGVAPPELRRKIQKAAGPQAVITQDLAESQVAARYLQQPPAGRSADGLLVQPLQRLPGQGRRPLSGDVL